MNTQNSRSKELLKKVYNHLDSIDISKLSLSELGTFLEVVQKGQFLETTGQLPGFGFGGWGGNSLCAGRNPFPSDEKSDGEDQTD